MDTQIDLHEMPGAVAGRALGARATQQDDLVCLHDAEQDAHLLVLADGMGGDGAGELASDGVITAARRVWDKRLWMEQAGMMFLETLCQQAHAELRRRGEQLEYGEPHSTVVALLLKGQRAYWAHVGDSRLYRFQGRRCLGRTEDHSLAQLKVRRGEITPEQLGRDADQDKLLRGLGGAQPPEVEHGGATLHPGQAFALCSDGVWAHVSTLELARLMRRSDQGAAVREMLALAVERAGRDADNAALILVRPSSGGWLQRQTMRLRALVRPEGKRGHAALRISPAHSHRRSESRWLRALCAVALAMPVLGMFGCAQVESIKHKAGDMLRHRPRVTVTRTSHNTPRSDSTLSAIINHQLQHGRYEQGHSALREYLKQHPDSARAKRMLRQLTADPRQMLGADSQAHVVQSGDSYSTLAQQYLGDPDRFLILARYNHSSNPSVLSVGQTIRVPVAADVPAKSEASSEPDATEDAATTTDSSSVVTIKPGQTPQEQAQRLQQQSLDLLDQGKHQQALDSMGKALALDPGLQSHDARTDALRNQLLASYHQRAIVLYRDQKLDKAIALWDRVLAIDPDYQPAVAYRARAVELKQRLKKF